MFFWFISTAILSVAYVFRDTQFDNRILILGVLIPDVVDGLWGRGRAFHSIAGSVAVLMVVMFTTIGRRTKRKKLLAIPIGMFLHLIFDGAFNNTKVFWWPFTGLSFDKTQLPIASRGLLNILFESVGLLLFFFMWKKFHLADSQRRRIFIKTGSLSPSGIGNE